MVRRLPLDCKLLFLLVTLMTSQLVGSNDQIPSNAQDKFVPSPYQQNTTQPTTNVIPSAPSILDRDEAKPFRKQKNQEITSVYPMTTTQQSKLTLSMSNDLHTEEDDLIYDFMPYVLKQNQPFPKQKKQEVMFVYPTTTTQQTRPTLPAPNDFRSEEDELNFDLKGETRHRRQVDVFSGDESTTVANPTPSPTFTTLPPTTGTTSLPLTPRLCSADQNAPTAHLDEVCANNSCIVAACDTPGSVCVPRNGSYMCGCAAGRVRNFQSRSCVNAPPGVFADPSNRQYSRTIQNTSIGSQVLNIPLMNLNDHKPVYTTSILPSTAPLSATISQNASLLVLTVTRDGLAPGLTILAITLTATMDDVRISETVLVSLTVASSSPVTITAVMMDGSPPGSLVAETSATGYYLPPGQLYTYSVAFDSTGPQIQGLFTVSSSGKVTSTRTIDLDTIANQTTGALEAYFTVSVSSGMSSTVLARVHVLMVRRHLTTTLSESYPPGYGVAQFRLDAMTVFLLSAINLDTTTFQFSSSSGILTTNALLDYERQKSYSFIVSVQGQTLTASVTVMVQVANVNDNPPAIHPPTPRQAVVISGTFPGSVIVVINATDPDNDLLTYSIKPPYDTKFTVSPAGIVTSQVIMNAKEFNGLSNFTVEVVVTDRVYSSTALLPVYLVQVQADQNNLNRVYQGNVTENQPPGVTVGLQAPVYDVHYTGYRLIPDKGTVRINSTTAEIITQTTFDREANASEVYYIQAQEAGGISCTQVTMGVLTISINDVNDNAPVLSSNYYIGTLQEESPPGTIVSFWTTVSFDTTVSLRNSSRHSVSIIATDQDTGINANLTFVLLGTDSGNFTVEKTRNNMAVVRAKRVLDREVTPVFNVTLLVHDKGQFFFNTTALLIISLTDINDNQPVFINPPGLLHVIENDAAALNIHLNLSDPDFGLNSDVILQVTRGGYEFFNIRSPAYLTLTKPLDRESIATFNLTITAYDLGSPPLSSSTAILVIVDDANDNSPVFNRSSFHVTENTNCSIAFVATDADIGSNAAITYSHCINSSITDLTVDASGKISCVRPLDYETTKNLTLCVLATDAGLPPLSSSTSVTVIVDDVNDNSPVFDRGVYSVNATTVDVQANKPFLVVLATDADSADNGKVSYTIGRTDFTIDSRTGLVSIGNHNLSIGYYSINISAVDHGTPPLATSAFLSVNVRDTARKNVAFSNTIYALSVEEERDPNTGPIGRVTVQPTSLSVLYIELQGSDTLYINATTGELYLTTKLDREAMRDTTIAVIVQAVPLNATGDGDFALVKINVTDINDNAPTFTNPSSQFTLELKESISVGTILIYLTAMDPDAGVNGTVIFSTSPSVISVDQNTGNVTLRELLDRETQSIWNLPIWVRDLGTPSLTSNVSLLIYVADVNDNAPQIQLNSTSVIVPEGNAINSRVPLRIITTDADIGDNARVEMINEVQRVGANELCPFNVIDGAEVQLLLNIELDFENTSRYVCLLKAHDDATNEPQLTGSVSFTLSVADVNDNAPVFFNAPYFVNVSLDEEADGSVILSDVSVTDADSGINSLVNLFLFDDGNFSGNFAIDSSSRNLTLVTNLNGVTADNLTIYIIARDLGEPSLSSTAEVFINIISSNAKPEFSRHVYYVSLEEEQLPPPVLALLNVTDLDDRRMVVPCLCNYSVYSVTPADLKAIFTLQPIAEGVEVILVTRLDREAVGNSITVIVQAVDNGSPSRSSTATVQIDLKDINDNGPKINQTIVSFVVNQDTVVNTVLQPPITAHDPDLGNNAITNFFIKNALSLIDKPLPFMIDPTSGFLIVNDSLLNADFKDYRIIITIVARDPGNNYTDEATANVSLTYRNPNNPPTFTSTSYSASVNFLALHGTAITVPNLSISDPDHDPFNCSIINGNQRSVVETRNNSCDLYLRFNLDDTIMNPISLTLQVQDNPKIGFPQTSTSMVVITIIDREPTQCDLVSNIQRQQAEKTKYTILFAVFCSIVGLLLFALIFVIYKWRVAKQKLPADSDNQQAHYYSRPVGSALASHVPKAYHSAGKRNPVFQFIEKRKRSNLMFQEPGTQTFPLTDIQAGTSQ